MSDPLSSLGSAVELSMDIVAAQDGSDEARERLAEPRTMEMKFPGSKDRAMGHALKIIEDLEELGINASREYHEVALSNDEGTIHRIDIIVEGGA